MSPPEIADQLARVQARAEWMVSSRLLTPFTEEENAAYRSLVTRERHLIEALALAS